MIQLLKNSSMLLAYLGGLGWEAPILRLGASPRTMVSSVVCSARPDNMPEVYSMRLYSDGYIFIIAWCGYSIIFSSSKKHVSTTLALRLLFAAVLFLFHQLSSFLSNRIKFLWELFLSFSTGGFMLIGGMF